MAISDSVLIAPNGIHAYGTNDSLRANLTAVSDRLLGLLRPPSELSPGERRGMIARYAAVLEGNFIYWMTGAYLAARSDEARAIITDNLLEEVRDSHPAMLRRFIVAADAVPTDSDVERVAFHLNQVRLFIGRLAPVPILAMMAFFEGFIQRYMDYLEELARLQGSLENEYTRVHGVCDIAHSEGLLNAVKAEMALAADSELADDSIYEGVHLLERLLEDVFASKSSSAAA